MRGAVRACCEAEVVVHETDHEDEEETLGRSQCRRPSLVFLSEGSEKSATHLVPYHRGMWEPHHSFADTTAQQLL